MNLVLGCDNVLGMSKAYADNAFWYSRISDAQTCLRKYKLKHLDKVVIDEPGSADLSFGTAVHLGLNESLLGGNGLGLFEVFWGSVKNEAMDYGRCDWEALNHLGGVFISRFDRLHKKHFEPFQMEERLYTELEGIPFEGTPDFLGKYKGVPAVVDFKTAGYRYNPRKIICDEQMALYALMAEKATGFKPEKLVYIVFIKDPKNPSIQTLEFDLTDTKLFSTLENVTQVSKDLQTRKDFPQNTASCLRGSIVCSYFETCHGRKA